MKSDKTRPIALIDFGASRIKAALWLPCADQVLHKSEISAPVLSRGPQGEAEGSPEDYWVALSALLREFCAINDDLFDVWLCSEMHGFLLSKNDSPEPLTKYISWQDQRGIFRTPGEPSALEFLIDAVGSSFQRESGLRLRAGLPVLNLLFLRQLLQGARPVRFLTLMDWLLVRGGEKDPHCHTSLAAGTGLFSIVEGDWSIKIIRTLGIDTSKLLFPTVSHDLSRPIGDFNVNGKNFRAWGGIGDLQAAAHGLGFPEESKVLINLGTGSQVMVESNLDIRDSNCEVKVSAEGVIANTITHIPSGRALNTFASFIDECSAMGGGGALFWRKFSSLDFQKVIEAPPTINLNVFAASWRYADGGSISGILENGFTCDRFLESLARSWLEQYGEAVGLLTDSRAEKTFVLGGGLSRIGPFVVPALEHILKKACVPVNSATGEESLDGLLRLVKKYFLIGAA